MLYPLTCVPVGAMIQSNVAERHEPPFRQGCLAGQQYSRPVFSHVCRVKTSFSPCTMNMHDSSQDKMSSL